jgi:hypothetical protein
LVLRFQSAATAAVARGIEQTIQALVGLPPVEPDAF